MGLCESHKIGSKRLCLGIPGSQKIAASAVIIVMSLELGRLIIVYQHVLGRATIGELPT